MPAATKRPTSSPAKKPVNQSVADQAKVAGANLIRNQTRAANAGRVGYIIHSPTWQKLGPKGERLWEIGKCVLPIHRHNVITSKGKTVDDDGRTNDKFYTYEGSVLVGLDGKWFTTKEVEANYIKSYYGPMGYVVTEVRRDKEPSILEQDAYLEAEADAIMSGDYDPSLGLDEAHPDTPRIITE